MPEVKDREALTSEEFLEFVVTGPFGGVQSELAETMYESLGFKDTQNVLFYRGVGNALPGFASIIPNDTENDLVQDFAHWYASDGSRQFVKFVFTSNGGVLKALNSFAGSWDLPTGPALSLRAAPPVAWGVLNKQLCFGTLDDQIMLYPGDIAGASPGAYTLSSASAPYPFSLAEIGLHLMAGGTLSSPYQYFWSGAGDPTDWTSFSSGNNNELVDIGPIQGIQKLGQYGFGYHTEGIIQIIPTGNGQAPFGFYPLQAARSGLIFNRTLSKITIQGVDCGVFVGNDNVYLNNQSSLLPIGDAPLDQRRRVGARQFIMRDVYAAYANANEVFGVCVKALNALPFNSYWLFCLKNYQQPAVNNVWVYNFDEANWMRLNFFTIPNNAGIMPSQAGPSAFSVSDSLAMSMLNQSGPLPSVYLDTTTGLSENPMSVSTGGLIFGDRRHKKTCKGFRLVSQDNGPCTYTVVVSNQAGYTWTSQPITLGGSNNQEDLVAVIPISPVISGIRFYVQILTQGGQPFSLVEFALLYDIGGEQRNFSVDGN